MNRSELIEEIEIALVELKEIAQPHEMATLRELLLDATEVEEDQLPPLTEQFKSLRSFCEQRKKSEVGFTAVFLPHGRRKL